MSFLNLGDKLCSLRRTVTVAVITGIAVMVLLCLVACTVTGDVKYKTSDGSRHKPDGQSSYRLPALENSLPAFKWVGEDYPRMYNPLCILIHNCFVHESG